MNDDNWYHLLIALIDSWQRCKQKHAGKNRQIKNVWMIGLSVDEKQVNHFVVEGRAKFVVGAKTPLITL